VRAGSADLGAGKPLSGLSALSFCHRSRFRRRLRCFGGVGGHPVAHGCLQRCLGTGEPGTRFAAVGSPSGDRARQPTPDPPQPNLRRSRRHRPSRTHPAAPAPGDACWAGGRRDPPGAAVPGGLRDLGGQRRPPGVEAGFRQRPLRAAGWTPGCGHRLGSGCGGLCGDR